MPRPKRTKVAPSAPAPQGRKPAKPTAEAVSKSQAPESFFDDIYDANDHDTGNHEDRSLRTAGHAKKHNGKERDITTMQDQYDQTGTITGPLQTSKSLQKRGGTMATSIDHASARIGSEEAAVEDPDLGSSSPAVEIGRRERSMCTVESSLLALGDFRGRAREPNIPGREAGRARSSSVDSELAEEKGITTLGRNASTISVANFKRRQREPSILGRNAPPVRSSSAGLETDRGTPASVASAYKIGTFRRRAREPSILRTAQKDQEKRPLFDDEDEDDFNPEDESTPLNLSKNKASTENVSPSNPSTSSMLNPRKRKRSGVQVPSQSPTLPSTEMRQSIFAVGSRSTNNEEIASSPPVRQETRYTTPEPLSETMAPPQSGSSPSPSPEVIRAARERITRGQRLPRGRTPPPATQDSPISSPPSLTHSPNRPVAPISKAMSRGRRESALPTTFSTAQLQALLPRRRRRPVHDTFDIASSDGEIDISGLDSNDDELTHSSIRAPPRRPSRLISRTPAPLKRGPKPKPSQKILSKQPGAKRTYGSRGVATSDKENEELDPNDSLGPIPDNDGNGRSETSQELERRVGVELKKAARKFQEVDKWELEFEDMTASSSSPRDSR